MSNKPHTARLPTVALATLVLALTLAVGLSGPSPGTAGGISRLLGLGGESPALALQTTPAIVNGIVGDGFDSAIIEPMQVATMTVRKTLLTTNPAQVGDAVQFEIVIENHSNVELSTVSLTDLYQPTYLTYVGADPPSDDNNDDGKIEWNDVGPIPVNGLVPIVVNFTAARSTDNPTMNFAKASATDENGDQSEADGRAHVRIVPAVTPTSTPTTGPTLTPTASPTLTPTASPTAIATTTSTATAMATPTATSTAQPTSTPTELPGRPRAYLPMVARDYVGPVFCRPPDEAVSEPKNGFGDAFGPMCPDQMYRDTLAADDVNDVYYLLAAGDFEVLLTDIDVGEDYDLVVYNQNFEQAGISQNGDNSDEYVDIRDQGPGRYYVRVFRFQGADGALPYALSWTPLN